MTTQRIIHDRRRRSGSASLGLLLMATTAGCAEPSPSEAPEGSPRQARATVSTTVDAPLGEVFDYVVDRETPARDLRGYGRVPGVRGDVQLTEGGWDHPGARRVVVLEDGTTLREDIEVLERPARFEYRVHDFQFAINKLASEGRGEWTFAQTQAGTRVTWTYVFAAKRRATLPALRAVVSKHFEPYMQNGLDSIRAHIEDDS
ncbi:SRPBCC family protein [Pseudenhygromyxa sp. WMMC2535]|uniref:SRPBCC family protein n=1 Tax=Pseudenhygromyxa sp. WMMC2535 TaxID=2712867 RepID=UPI00155775D2|nr:SRPBCC family protein [Pseudenhygromyxa sp. WMMC2535]NVB38259.1 SRPBCC family protein [Pseudenhygromyxa sp. WMMC2535]